MKILHIINDYAGSRVHSNLVKELDALGVDQTVYCPVRDKAVVGRNQIETQHTHIEYSYAIKPWHHYLYHCKCHALYADMERHVDLKGYDLIHASTLFSDGALAYMAHCRYGTPYVVAVRSTDSYYFASKMPHTWHLGRRILEHAERVYYVSESLRWQFEGLRFLAQIKELVSRKSVLRPNGLDSYWISHIDRQPHQPCGHRVLYIGKFKTWKNVPRLISAISKVRCMEGLEDTTLTVVGGGNDKGNRVADMIAAHKDYITYLGQINDKDRLTQLMHEHTLFAMPSYRETFGLAFVECLSQGLPVLYGRGESVDGLFSDKPYPVGESADVMDVDSIAEALRRMLLNPERYGNRGVDFEVFEWPRIAKAYYSDYQSIIKADKK